MSPAIRTSVLKPFWEDRRGRRFPHRGRPLPRCGTAVATPARWEASLPSPCRPAGQARSPPRTEPSGSTARAPHAPLSNPSRSAPRSTTHASWTLLHAHGRGEGDVAAAVQRHGEDGRGCSLLVLMDGSGRSLGVPHGPAADGEGGGRVRAQAVEASKLHAADQAGVGRVDPDVAHAGLQQDRADCRVEAGICEGG